MKLRFVTNQPDRVVSFILKLQKFYLREEGTSATGCDSSVFFFYLVHICSGKLLSKTNLPGYLQIFVRLSFVDYCAHMFRPHSLLPYLFSLFFCSCLARPRNLCEQDNHRSNKEVLYLIKYIRLTQIVQYFLRLFCKKNENY